MSPKRGCESWTAGNKQGTVAEKKNSKKKFKKKIQKKKFKKKSASEPQGLILGGSLCQSLKKIL